MLPSINNEKLINDEANTRERIKKLEENNNLKDNTGEKKDQNILSDKKSVDEQVARSGKALSEGNGEVSSNDGSKEEKRKKLEESFFRILKESDESGNQELKNEFKKLLLGEPTPSGRSRRSTSKSYTPGPHQLSNEETLVQIAESQIRELEQAATDSSQSQLIKDKKRDLLLYKVHLLSARRDLVAMRAAQNNIITAPKSSDYATQIAGQLSRAFVAQSLIDYAVIDTKTIRDEILDIGDVTEEELDSAGKRFESAIGIEMDKVRVELNEGLKNTDARWGKAVAKEHEERIGAMLQMAASIFDVSLGFGTGIHLIRTLRKQYNALKKANEAIDDARAALKANQRWIAPSSLPFANLQKTLTTAIKTAKTKSKDFAGTITVGSKEWSHEWGRGNSARANLLKSVKDEIAEISVANGGNVNPNYSSEYFENESRFGTDRTKWYSLARTMGNLLAKNIANTQKQFLKEPSARASGIWSGAGSAFWKNGLFNAKPPSEHNEALNFNRKRAQELNAEAIEQGSNVRYVVMNERYTKWHKAGWHTNILKVPKTTYEALQPRFMTGGNENLIEIGNNRNVFNQEYNYNSYSKEWDREYSEYTDAFPIVENWPKDFQVSPH
ncbi:hypothetical protein CS022_23935 [Veronia nyctiphanis]|uniref:Uncharacterized protein n=1 Tax=Veronia nyctiphanis TaxID=1278244 RepID=A0A4Q0YFU6_9GAMM|nr:hypothetical protein CS022_23935 [Veronia nyctiphanis]